MSVRKGFSLIELVLAILIFSLAVIPIIGVLSGGDRGAVRGGNEVVAVRLAWEIGEQLMMLDSFPGFDRIAGRENLADVLNNLNEGLGEGNRRQPYSVPLAATGIRLLVAPLPENFIERRVEAQSFQGPECLPGEWARVRVRIGWKLPGQSKTGLGGLHTHDSYFFVRRGAARK